ncbi:MAG: TolC family protein [Bacteroidia bacterium]|nr:TolC family protein [Bacteroidia bacterium]
MKKYIVSIFVLLSFILHAQLPLTLRSSIDTALKNSYDIQIERNNFEISKINNSFGVAGGFPVVNAGAAGNKYTDHVSQNNNGVPGTETYSNNGNSVNADISASMTLFNGCKIIATKKRLNYLQKQNEITLNLQIQNTIAGVKMQYYDIIRQESYLATIRNSLEVSNKKLDIIKEKKMVGMASDVDMLQAKTDVSLAEQNLILQRSTVDQSKTELLSLMNAKNKNTFEVEDNITVDSTLVFEKILIDLKNNLQYLSAEQEVMISEQSVREISSQRYPSLKANAAYNYSKTNNDAGSVLMNKNTGPEAGLTLQIPIFNGFIYKSQRSVAELTLNNAKLQKESLLNSLTYRAVNLYQIYSTALQQIVSQQKTCTMSKQLVDLVMKNFQVNQATILDVKAAQSSLENASYLLVNLKYSAKIAEIELKELDYKLEY